MGKTVNRNDVAKRAGVAPSTVSNVINGTKFVSEDVKQRVLRAIAELEYEPNLLARSFKMNSTKQVTILLSTLDNFDELYRGMYEIAFPTGYSLNVIIANDNRINYYNNCYAHRSEGIINLSRFFCTEKEYNKLISHDIAVVGQDARRFSCRYLAQGDRAGYAPDCNAVFSRQGGGSFR